MSPNTPLDPNGRPTFLPTGARPHRRRYVDQGNATAGAIAVDRARAIPAGVGAARFPAAPVRALVAHRMTLGCVSLAELAVTLRLPLRTLQRVRRSEVLGWTVADRCAVALGYHPSQLWPEWFAAPAAHRPRAAPSVAGSVTDRGVHSSRCPSRCTDSAPAPGWSRSTSRNVAAAPSRR